MVETITRTADPQVERLVALHKELPTATGAIAKLRSDGLSRFLELGFPTTRQEEWIYTNVAPIARTPFVLGSDRDSLAVDRFKEISLSSIAAAEIVFVNGIFSAELSTLSSRNVNVQTFSAAMSKDGGVLERHLGKYVDAVGRAFSALNSAFLSDGVLIHAPGAREPKPIHVLYVATPQEQPRMISPRVLVVAEDNSQITLVESYVSLARGNYFTNAVTEIVLGENAVVDHTKVQRESDHAFHISTTEVVQKRSSSYFSHSISFGGGITRNDLNTKLDGEGADAQFDGLYVLEGNQHVDNHTLIDHAKPNATSSELYKGVLDGSSRGVFDGRIIVRKDAQKTSSRQTNNNLLLSDEAVIDTKPQLEIHADDVKCNHGSTIGQLNENAVFYLQSRGIGTAEARNILTFAFASEIVYRLKVEPLRKQLEELLLNRLPKRIDVRKSS